MCYLFENHNDICIDELTNLPTDLLDKPTEELFDYLDNIIKRADIHQSFLIIGWFWCSYQANRSKSWRV